MKNMGKEEQKEMRSRFPISLFGIYFGVLLMMSGIHVGLIVFMNKVHMHTVIQCILPLVYWVAVAGWLTYFTRNKIKKTYEEPMQELARATEAVANGDFSVYVPTINTSDRLDYLDLMILDFNKMVEELGSIETLKTDFVSNVSHEMKTPIAIMKNYAELLERDNISDQQRKEYAKTIGEASRRLSNLIGNILKLNKLENQRIVPEAEIYDVSRQVCDCLLQYEEIWEEKEIELDVELDDSIYIKADESLMELVWNNLISNALKFTEKGGQVGIKQAIEDGNVKISVIDTGCGMKEETKKHVFDKFYQGDTSRSKEGNGLGLALVKRVIELMDGDIFVESEEGKGSIFTVTMAMEEGRRQGRGEF